MKIEKKKNNLRRIIGKYRIKWVRKWREKYREEVEWENKETSVKVASRNRKCKVEREMKKI